MPRRSGIHKPRESTHVQCARRAVVRQCGRGYAPAPQGRGCKRCWCGVPVLAARKRGQRRAASLERRKCVTRMGLDSCSVCACIRARRVRASGVCVCVFAHTRTRGPAQGPARIDESAQCRLLLVRAALARHVCCSPARGRGHGRLEQRRETARSGAPWSMASRREAVLYDAAMLWL